MKGKLIALPTIFAVAVVTIVALKGVLPGSADTAGPTAESPLPVVLAGGEARPTFTPVPVPQLSATIGKAQAEDIAGRLMGPAADRDSISAVLGTVGQTDVTLHVPEYPVWLVTASGSFHSTFQRCCDPPPVFNEMTVILDATDGKILGYEWK